MGKKSSDQDHKFNELFSAIKLDDQATLNRFFEAFSPVLLKYCTFLIGNQELAEEICHESLSKMLQNLSFLSNYSHAKAWSFRVSKNLYIDHLRKHKREELTEDISQFVSLDGDEQDKSAAFDILKTLNKLKTPDKEVILLIDLQGMSYSEASEVLEITEAAVRSRLHKARKKFLEIYGND